MSYSFNVTAATKAEAGQAVAAELSKVVAGQPVHENDRQLAQSAAEAVIQVLADPSDIECVSLSVAGSLGWLSEGIFTSANLSVNARIAPKP